MMTLKHRINILLRNTTFRYLFAIATVAASAFALLIWLIPWTGPGVPVVLFFAAVVVTSLLALRSLEHANRQMRESEEKYRALFDSIDEGFCVIEVLFDDAGNAVDYRFLEVNRVFEQQTGISHAVGRRMRDIAPAHEEHWFRFTGRLP
jgi:PAS domain-containing protein